MRAQCSVCQELFSDSDVVVAPQCGHTFHNTCITQWLATKKSCPTCRQTTAQNKLTRIFFDIAFTADVDPGDMQQKLDETTLELQGAQRELREARHEAVTLKKKANKYCREKKDAEEKVRDQEIIVANMQQRLDFLNRQVTTLTALEEELHSCKEKLKLMENVQQIVNSTQKEVEEMMEQYGDRSETAKSLSTQCVILSRELNAKTEMKQKADEDLRKCRRLLSTLRVELQQAKKELKDKEEQSSLAEEDIKRYSAENAKLQEKLRVLSEAVTSPSGDPRNSALNRLLHESPAPAHLRLSNIMMGTPSSSTAGTPSTPFLPPKNKMKPGASQLLLSSQDISSMRPKLSDPQKEDVAGKSVSQSKQARKLEDPAIPDPDVKFNKIKRMKPDLSVPSTSSGFFYDGMGGHSKPDIYPRGSSSQPSSRPQKGVGETTSIKKRGPVTMKIKGKTQTTTLDYFYSQ